MRRLLRSKEDFNKTIIRNQISSLILYEAIVTTKKHAKNLYIQANKFLHSTKKADLTARKLAHQTLLAKPLVDKLINEILPRYDFQSNPHGSFLKLLRYHPRRGDNAERFLVVLSKTADYSKNLPNQTKNQRDANQKITVTVKDKKS